MPLLRVQNNSTRETRGLWRGGRGKATGGILPSAASTVFCVDY